MKRIRREQTLRKVLRLSRVRMIKQEYKKGIRQAYNIQASFYILVAFQKGPIMTNFITRCQVDITTCKYL